MKALKRKQTQHSRGSLKIYSRYHSWNNNFVSNTFREFIIIRPISDMYLSLRERSEFSFGIDVSIQARSDDIKSFSLPTFDCHILTIELGGVPLWFFRLEQNYTSGLCGHCESQFVTCPIIQEQEGTVDALVSKMPMEPRQLNILNWHLRWIPHNNITNIYVECRCRTVGLSVLQPIQLESHINQMKIQSMTSKWFCAALTFSRTPTRSYAGMCCGYGHHEKSNETKIRSCAHSVQKSLTHWSLVV